MTLGERIKKLRLNNEMSVRHLAEKVGVTASFIYQLEQNKVSPSFSTLKSIATHLNTSMSLLVEDNLPEEWVIVRLDRRKKIILDNDSLNLEVLTFLGYRDKKMQPMVFYLEAGGKTEKIDFVNVQREDFIYLLQGKVEITVNQTKYILEQGDAAYFIFDAPSCIENIGEQEASGLWIISPPGI